MKLIEHFAALTIIFASSLAISHRGCSQTNANRIAAMFTLTPSYKQIAINLMVNEASLYSERLGLPEAHPLGINNIKNSHVTFPYVFTKCGALGSIATSKFSYGFGKGKHLTYITRFPHDNSGRPLYERLKPWELKSDPDTNSAYKTAEQYLNKAFVDVSKMSTGATVTITPLKVIDMVTSIYTIEWRHNEQVLSQVVICEPNGELWSLRIEHPEYIRREPIEISQAEKH